MCKQVYGKAINYLFTVKYHFKYVSRRISTKFISSTKHLLYYQLCCEEIVTFIDEDQVDT